MNTILLVDDEHPITDVLQTYFEKLPAHVVIAHTGSQALDLLEKHVVDLVILDLMLPDMRGEDICRYLKLETSIPVIMLTAKISIEDKLNGFHIGADDYVIKPFHPKEIVARAKRLLPKSANLQVGAINYEATARLLTLPDEAVKLTENEGKIMTLLLENPTKVFSRYEMIENLFSEETDPRVIDQHIKNIRKKINYPLIQTVFGIGYKLEEVSHLS